MQVFKTKRAKTAVAALAMLSVLGAACGDDSNDDAAPAAGQNQSATTAQSGQAASVKGIDTGAATLRAGLTDLLSEHVYLAALATGSALRGDTAGFEQFATALNGPTNSNTADLVAAIGSAYGPDVGRPSTACGAVRSTSRSSWPTPRRRPRTTRPGRTRPSPS